MELPSQLDTLVVGAGQPGLTMSWFLQRAGREQVPFAYDPPQVPELDLAEATVSTVLWATGYAFDHGWIELPVFDPLGFPRQARGVTEIPGLHFIGSLWLHTQASATLFGVGLDARVLAERMGLAPRAELSASR